MSTTPAMLTVNQTAATLGVCRLTVIRYIKRGTLPAVKPDGYHTFIPAWEVHRLRAARTVGLEIGMVNRAEAAALLGCKPAAVYRHASRLGLGRKVGRVLMYTEDEVDAIRRALKTRRRSDGRPPGMMSQSEVLAHHQITRETLRNWKASGKLVPAAKVKNRPFYRVEDVAAVRKGSRKAIAPAGYVTPSEAARMSRMHLASVYAAIKSGRVPSFRSGGHVFIPTAAVGWLVDRRRNRQLPRPEGGVE